MDVISLTTDLMSMGNYACGPAPRCDDREGVGDPGVGTLCHPGTACPRHVIALVCIIGHEFLLPAPHLNLARTVNNKNWEAASMAPNSLN